MNISLLTLLQRGRQTGLLVFFAALVILGILCGEPVKVLEQARQLCLECIGIG